jgi:hypothetical protein
MGLSGGPEERETEREIKKERERKRERKRKRDRIPQPLSFDKQTRSV